MEELIKKCNKAVNVEIRKESRAEAKEILFLATEKEQQEFIDYHEKDMGSICCLVLDKIKEDLVRVGKLILNKDDSFGHPITFED